MNASQKPKRDGPENRIAPERLLDVIAELQADLQSTKRELQSTKRELQTAKLELKKAQERIEELEKQVRASTTTRTDEAYSMKAEEKRQAARGKKKKKLESKGRRGRVSTAEKLALAKRTERVFPVGVAESECYLSHVRPVWRLEENRTILIAYEIYRGPKNQYGIIPGVMGRSEFGQEICVAIGHLVYLTGLSFGKVCQVFEFFQGLPLRKSQVNALLNQLSRHWSGEFETLCTLLANSMVVHADETSWSLNSVWAFLSEKARILFFGVHKDAQTLKTILDPETFGGIVISDDAAVYANFSKSQKCWAHLLRKAIKLTLLDPDKTAYRKLTDRMLEIYRKALAVQSDGQLSHADRLKAVAELEDAVGALCRPTWCVDLPPLEGAADDHRLLLNELGRLLVEEQLFTFVTASPVTQPNGKTHCVAGTNNESERTLRNPAEARATGRTNKTDRGTRQRTVVTSVLESLRLYLPTFTLATVIAEVRSWEKAGRSCFEKLLAKLKILPPEVSVLDSLFPKPSG